MLSRRVLFLLPASGSIGQTGGVLVCSKWDYLKPNITGVLSAQEFHWRLGIKLFALAVLIVVVTAMAAPWWPTTDVL